VVERTKTCVLDTLGCCLFGSTQPSVRKRAQRVASEDSGGHAIVMGTAQRESASMAALVNATAAHSFQLDEIHIQATLHPGSAAVPAVRWPRVSRAGAPLRAASVRRSSPRSATPASRMYWRNPTVASLARSRYLRSATARC